MSRPQQVGAGIFATAQEIARGFLLLGRNVNRGEGTGAVQDGELAGIAAISLDAIAGAAGNQRRRNDVAGNLPRRERALQLEAARAGFVAAGHGALTLRPLDKAHDRRAVRRQRMERRSGARGVTPPPPLWRRADRRQ